MKLFSVLVLLLSFSPYAQQEPVSGMYWNNYSYYNPAMSAVRNNYEAAASGRFGQTQNYVTPRTLFLNYGMNIAEKHGIGVNSVYYESGYTVVQQAKVNYNYQLKFKNDDKLVLGTALSFSRNGWASYIMNVADLIYTEPKKYVCVDLGVAYYGKHLTAGISSTQLPVYRSADYFTITPYYFGNLRYELGLSPQPNFLILETKIHTDLVVYRQDFNVGYNYKQLVEGGIGYRTSDAFLFNLTGIFAKHYRVGYLYELPINKLSNGSRGTHELAIGFRIPN